MGHEGIQKELELAGLATCGAEEPDPFNGEPISIDSFNNFPMDKDIDVVLVAQDQNFNYTKLCLASLYIQNGKAKFICTNEEPN